MNKVIFNTTSPQKLKKSLHAAVLPCAWFYITPIVAQPVFYAVNTEICSSNRSSQVAFFAWASRPTDSFGELTINFGDNTTRTEMLFFRPTTVFFHTYSAPLQASYRVTASWRPHNSNQSIPMFDFLLPVVACSQPLQRQFAFPNAFASFGHTSTVDSHNNLWIAGDGLNGHPVTPGAYKTAMTPQGWFSNDSRVIKFCGISGVIDCASFIGGGDRNTGDTVNNDRFKAEDIISIVPGLDGEVYISGMTSDPDTIPARLLLGGSSYNGNRSDGTFTRNTFVARFDNRCRLVWGAFLGNTLHNNAGRITISPDGEFLYVLLDTNVNQQGQPLTISDGTNRFQANRPNLQGFRGAIAKLNAANGRVENIGYYRTGDNEWFVNGHGDAVVYFPVVARRSFDMVIVASNPNLNLISSQPNNNSGILLTGFSQNNLARIGEFALGTLTTMPSLAAVPVSPNITALYVTGELRRDGSIHNQRNTQKNSDVFIARLININRTNPNPLGLSYSTVRTDIAPGNHYGPQIVSFRTQNNAQGLYLSTFTDEPSGVTQSNAHRPLFSYIEDRLDRTLVRISLNLTLTSSRTYVGAGLRTERNRFSYDWANLSVTREGNVVVVNNSIPDSNPFRSGAPETISLPYVTPEYFYKIAPPYVNDPRISPNLPGWNETLISVFGDFQNNRPTVPRRGVDVTFDSLSLPPPPQFKADSSSANIGGPIFNHRVIAFCREGFLRLQLNEFCGMWECHFTIEVQDRYTGQWQVLGDYPAWALNEQQRPLAENMIFPLRRGFNVYRLTTRCPFAAPDAGGNPDVVTFSILCCDTNRANHNFDHPLLRVCLDESVEIRLTENYNDQTNIAWSIVSGDATLTPGESNRSAVVSSAASGKVVVSVSYTDACGDRHTETFSIQFTNTAQQTNRTISISACPSADLQIGTQLPVEENAFQSSWVLDSNFRFYAGSSAQVSGDQRLLNLRLPTNQSLNGSDRTFTFTRITDDGCNTFTDRFNVTVRSSDLTSQTMNYVYFCRDGENRRTCISLNPKFSIEGILEITDLYNIENPQFISPQDYKITTDTELPHIVCIIWLNTNAIPKGMFGAKISYKLMDCNLQGIQTINFRAQNVIPENLPPISLSSCGNVFIPTLRGIPNIDYSLDLSDLPSDFVPQISKSQDGFTLTTQVPTQSVEHKIIINYHTVCGQKKQIVNVNFRSNEINLPLKISTCSNRVCFSLNNQIAAVEEIAAGDRPVEDFTYTSQGNVITYCFNWTTDSSQQIGVIALSLIKTDCPDTSLSHNITVERVPGPLAGFDLLSLEACTNSSTTLNVPDNGADYTLISEPAGLIITKSTDTAFTITAGSSVGTYTLTLTANNAVCEESRTITLAVRQCCDPDYVRSSVIFQEGCFQSLNFDFSVGSQPRRGVDIAWLARLNKASNQVELLDRTLCAGMCVEVEELRQQYQPQMIMKNGRLVPNHQAGQPVGTAVWVGTGAFASGNQRGIHFPGFGLTNPDIRVLAIRLKFKPNGCNSEEGSFYSDVFYPSNAPCDENIVIGGGGIVNPVILP